MAKNNYSTVVRFRCSDTEKEQIDKFVMDGQFKSISEFFRLLLNYYEDHSLDLLDYQHYCICRSQNRSCTDLKTHFNGYKTAPLPLLNRTNVYARTSRATLPVFESHRHGSSATLRR